ncbi:MULTISPECIES: DUF2267 domain-containing protein [Streptomyces]|uniref:DUF2267 domain-containing protein n=2 Tax=Streptomyces TaxID=1883 RepID=A0A4Y3R2I5_STRCI|nr:MULTISPECIES: DUF2267 domain-containing protein [Streptomyces]NNG89070.1 DUF2267 domain-containing protein [Streptomyces cacaoi]QHF97787.1 DUF2267 domain-containing protein [Streptomyces sp. NHF165]GEB51509.1 hypothetical protein SCA03_40600 [Streptomyces cacaoi]
MQWNDLVQQVRELGRYRTREQAERVLRAVLPLLARQLGPAERAALAARLPRTAAPLLAVPARASAAAAQPAGGASTGAEFVDALAARLGSADHAAARWDAGSVLCAVAVAAGEELTGRLIASLPPGYALLFGRAELIPAA